MSTDTHTHAHEEAGDHAEHGMSTRGYVNIATWIGYTIASMTR